MMSPRRQLEAYFGHRPRSRPLAGSWLDFHAGDVVCRKVDERHEGRLVAIAPEGCIVRWLERGWVEHDVQLSELLKVEAAR